MNFISLFTGVGMIDLGLERAGMTCIAQVEKDPWRRRVLAKHWRDVPRFNLVEEFGRGVFDGRPDLICGGFPCTDISRAGRGAGIDGENSGLWREFARIIREFRPGAVLVENSPALTERGLGRVLGDLAACGLDAEWDCLPAAAFGADHLRDRIYIVAYPHAAGWEGVLRGERRTLAAPRPLRKAVALADGRDALHGVIEGMGEPPVFGVDDGAPGRVDRLAACGDGAYVPLIEWIGRRIMAAAG